MKNKKITPVNNIIVKIKPRDWTNYTINDYCNALSTDYELAMKIREELFPGIAPVIRPKWADDEEYD